MNMFNDLASGSVLDLLVRITVILAAAWLAAGLFPKSAAIRHAILLSGIVGTFALPIVLLAASSLSVPRWNIEVAADITRAAAEPTDSVCLITTSSQETYSVHTPSDAATNTIITPLDPCDVPAEAAAPTTPAVFSVTSGTAPSWEIVTPIAAAIWAAVAAIRTIGLGLSLLRLRAIVNRAHVVDLQNAEPLLARIQRRVGLSKRPELHESTEIATPLSAGILGNYILVPAGWTNRLSRSELDSVLCHEAAHLARHDHRIVILQEVLASLLWFHPLVHLVNRALARSREEICDNFAIRSVDRPSYCAALFRLAGDRRPLPLAAATSLTSRHWSLEDRIRGILDERRPTVTGISRPARLSIVAFAVALCGLVTLPATTTAEPEQDTPEQEQSASSSASASASASTTTNDVEIRRIRDTRSLGDVRSIHISSRDGDLILDQADDGQLHIEAIVRIDAKQIDAATVGDKLQNFVELTVANGVLSILPRAGDHKPSQHGQVDLALSVPAGLAIEAQTNDGDIAVKELEASLSLTAHDGDIAIRSHSAKELAATTHDGDIVLDARGSAGKISLSAHDGDVVISADALHGDLNAETFTGDVTIKAGLVDAPLSVASNQGSVTVELTDSAAGKGDIAIATQTGDIVLSARAAKRVSANTAEGSIMLHFTGDGIQQELAAAASDGDVEIAVAPKTNADLALVTQDGDISIEGQPASGNLISTKLGSGGPRYAVLTTNGSIVIKTVEPQSSDDKAAE